MYFLKLTAGYADKLRDREGGYGNREELQFTNVTGRVQAHEIADLMRKYGTTADNFIEKKIIYYNLREEKRRSKANKHEDGSKEI
jgi:hypothetical protein